MSGTGRSGGRADTVFSSAAGPQKVLGAAVAQACRPALGADDSRCGGFADSHRQAHIAHPHLIGVAKLLVVRCAANAAATLPCPVFQ